MRSFDLLGDGKTVSGCSNQLKACVSECWVHSFKGWRACWIIPRQNKLWLPSTEQSSFLEIIWMTLKVIILLIWLCEFWGNNNIFYEAKSDFCISFPTGFPLSTLSASQHVSCSLKGSSWNVNLTSSLPVALRWNQRISLAHHVLVHFLPASSAPLPSVLSMFPMVQAV